MRLTPWAFEFPALADTRREDGVVVTDSGEGMMTIENGTGRERLANLTRIQKFGYGAIIFAAGLATGIERFTGSQTLLRQLFASIGTFEWFLAVLKALLLVYTVVLVLGWFYWTSYEFDMLREHINYMPPVRPRDYLLIPVVGGALGSLIYFSDRIVIFAAIFIACDIAAAVGTKDLNEGVALALRRTRAPGCGGDNKVAIYGAIEAYYLKKPHVRRIVLTSALRFAAFVLALYGALSQPGSDAYAKLIKDVPSWPTCVAYTLLLVIGVGAEVPIFRWRGARDSAIREAELERV